MSQPPNLPEFSNKSMRLQRLLAQRGLCSRRQGEQWIVAGRVEVNGHIAELGCQVDPETDAIRVDGQPLPCSPDKIYLLLHKPVGYVTTCHDPQGRQTVLELLPDWVPERVFPVGRLDINTSGLLLLTNDGDWAQQLAHPRYHISKTYRIRARGRLTVAKRQQLQKGVQLDDGMTQPARIYPRQQGGSHTVFDMVLWEGRNRQVRRMCQAVGLRVSRLQRLALGTVELGHLDCGQVRSLTAAEIAALGDAAAILKGHHSKNAAKNLTS